MARLPSIVVPILFVGIGIVVHMHQVDAANYGKVTCYGTKKVPGLSLIGSFAKAKCKLPHKFTEAELGTSTRCVFQFVKGFTPPNKFDTVKAMAAFQSTFPVKYHAGMKTKLSGCMSKHLKGAKDSNADPTGKTWTGLYNCSETWWNNDLCT